MARRMCNPKQPSRHITRPWLLLIATYPGHFDLVLNLCRSMAAHATDSGSVSVRFIVGDDEEVDGLYATLQGEDVDMNGGCGGGVNSSLLDVQAISIAQVAAPFDNDVPTLKKGFVCESQKLGKFPGCPPQGNKFLFQFLKKVLAARFFIGSRMILVLDSETEALARPFSFTALFHEHARRPIAFLSAEPERQVEHCSCSALLGMDDPMAAAPLAIPRDCTAEDQPGGTARADAAAAPSAWSPAKCLAASSQERTSSYRRGWHSRTPWGYFGWFWTHSQVRSMIEHIETQHRMPFVNATSRVFFDRGRCFAPTLYWMYNFMQERMREPARTETASAVLSDQLGDTSAQLRAGRAEAGRADAGMADAEMEPRDGHAAGGTSAANHTPGKSLTLVTSTCFTARHLPPHVPRPSWRDLEFLTLYLFSNDTTVLNGVIDMVNSLRLGFLRIPPMSFGAKDFAKWIKARNGGLLPTHLGYKGKDKIEYLVHSSRWTPVICPLFLHNLANLLRACPTVTFVVAESLPGTRNESGSLPCGGKYRSGKYWEILSTPPRWADALAEAMRMPPSATREPFLFSRA